MSFTHIQGVEQDTGTATTTSVVLGAAPTPGNIVCVAFQMANAISNLVIQDSNGHNYTLTAQSPYNNLLALAYLSPVPAGASATINFTWTTGAQTCIWVEEFGVSGE